jgi:hypothetical protein
MRMCHCMLRFELKALPVPVQRHTRRALTRPLPFFTSHRTPRINANLSTTSTAFTALSEPKMKLSYVCSAALMLTYLTFAVPVADFSGVYRIPSAADYNHPALNTTLLIEMLSHGVDPVSLPSLPLHISAHMRPFIKRDLGNAAADNATGALPSPERMCETSTGSPWALDINNLGGRLRQIANKDCCQLGKSCYNVGLLYTAGVSLCGEKGLCIKCGKLGIRVQEIAKHCRNGSKAGGIMR